MPVSEAQKQTMVAQARALARQITNLNKSVNAFIEEWYAVNYGGEIVQSVLDASPAPGLTPTEFADGVGAMDTVSSSIETNKTNLYKLAL